MKTIASTAALTALTQAATLALALPMATQESSPLPDGGGEPGAAYLACHARLQERDLDSLMRCVVASRAQEMRAMGEADAKEMVEFLQLLQPGQVEIIGGTVDGDAALLTVTGMREGEKSTGAIEMMREDGVWKVARESWQSGPR